MPLCGNCGQPCNCFISNDGLFAGAGSEDLGRNFTEVSGNGSAEDPYIISFLDSEEFRPKTAEVTFENITLPIGNTGGNGNFSRVQSANAFAPGSAIVYESPIHFLVRDSFTGDPGYAQANFFYLGASATFSPLSDVTSNARMLVLGTSKVDPNLDSHIIAGQTGAGGGGLSRTLTVEGYTVGTFIVSPGLQTLVQSFILWIYADTSSTSITISNLRFWMIQI